MIRGHAIYEGVYLLGTSIARPLIAKDQIRIAKNIKHMQYLMEPLVKEMIKSDLSLAIIILVQRLRS